MCFLSRCDLHLCGNQNMNFLQPKRELLLFQGVVTLHSSVQTNYGGDAGFEADPICPHDRFEACIENTNNNNKSRSERRHGQLGGSSNRSLGMSLNLC